MVQNAKVGCKLQLLKPRTTAGLGRDGVPDINEHILLDPDAADSSGHCCGNSPLGLVLLLVLLVLLVLLLVLLLLGLVTQSSLPTRNADFSCATALSDVAAAFLSE